MTTRADRADQYDRCELARKRYEAAVWMRNHRIERVDRLPHQVAVDLATQDWHRELVLLMEMEHNS